MRREHLPASVHPSPPTNALRDRGPRHRGTAREMVEWPTVAVWIGCHALWLAGLWGLTGVTADQPLTWWPCVALPYAVALHSSLQHEVLHGHPTRIQWLNELAVALPIGIFVPYGRFKQLHLRHHRDENLTDPYDDPESWYVSADTWQRLPWLCRLTLTVNATLAGRLALGPVLAVFGLLRHDLLAMCDQQRTHRNRRHITHAWGMHAVGVVSVGAIVVGLFGVPAWLYLLAAVYPGMSLLMLRTFTEHRAAATVGHRTAIVEASPVFALLFLNNNLHAVHHAHPRLPWYKLPAAYRAQSAHFLKRNGGFRFAGYGGIAAAYLFRPINQVLHPAHGGADAPLVGLAPTDGTASRRPHDVAGSSTAAADAPAP